MTENELLVSKIENGIVIDHIPAGKAFRVLKLLKLDPHARALIAQNVRSKSKGTKDLIKIEGSYLTSTELDIIAFVAPSATLNIVQDCTVKEKRSIELPDRIGGIFKCPNPLCDSNMKYAPPKTSFKVELGECLEDTRLHCELCESIIYYGSIRDFLTDKNFALEGGGLVSQEKIERVFLDVLLKGGALRLSPTPDQPFILKSGRSSPYFINLGALTDGNSLAKLKWAFASYIALLMERKNIPDFDYIFGPSYKGISLAALTCEGLNELFGMDKRYIYDRKEAKEYGDLTADKMLVGAGYFKPGQRFLVVDDSITTGLTKVETIEKLRMLGDHNVVGIVVAVDRQERLGDKDHIEEMTAVEHLSKQLGVRVFSIENISSIYRLLKDTLDDEMHRLWLDYFARYGAVELES